MSDKDTLAVLGSAHAAVWELVPPKAWEDDETGLILASKEDIRNGVVRYWAEGGTQHLIVAHRTNGFFIRIFSAEEPSI